VTRLEREVERFCALQVSRGSKPDYVERYRRDVASFVAFLGGLGKQDLREATPEDLVAFLLALDRRLARSTVNLRFWRLRKLLDFLVRARVLLRNPAAKLSRKHAPSRHRDWLGEDEVERLLEAIDAGDELALRDRALLELFYSSGLRLDEARRLELDDLDLAEGFVTVRDSKNRRDRRVPVGETAIGWLQRYLREARPRLLERRPPTAIVFLSRRATLLGKETIRARVLGHAARAGLRKHVTPHGLRHSFAVHLLRHGASTRHIQEMLGHRSLESTKLYTRLLPADLKLAHRRAHPRGRLPRRLRRR
jgi:integrase/recombinase XerD